MMALFRSAIPSALLATGYRPLHYRCGAVVVVPLDYDVPGRRKNVSILPLLPLGFVLLEVPWAFFCFIMEAGNMGDDKGMTPAVHAEMNLVGMLALAPVFFGLIFGLFAMTRIRSYGVMVQVAVAIGTLLCAMPFAFIVWDRIHRL